MLNIFPIRCNVNFETVISALHNTKRTENVTLNDIGNTLLVNLPRQNLKSGWLNLYRMCLTIKNSWMDLRLPRNKQFSTRTLRWDSVLEFFNWWYDFWCMLVLGSFQCRGVLLLWHMVGQGPAVLAAGAGWVGCFFFFFFVFFNLVYPIFLF